MDGANKKCHSEFYRVDKQFSLQTLKGVWYHKIDIGTLLAKRPNREFSHPFT